MAGMTLAVFRMASRWGWRKLETPMDLALPEARMDSRSAHLDWRSESESVK